jgi:hypothetical protein
MTPVMRQVTVDAKEYIEVMRLADSTDSPLATMR